MFNTSIKVDMPDFDRHEIEIDCPLCRLGNWTTLGAIRRRDYLVCRGCHSNILLEGHLGSVHRFTAQFKNMFKEFM